MSKKLDIIGIDKAHMDFLSTPEGKYTLPGGSSLNTIVALSRLGLKTGFISRVGKDDLGDQIRKDLESEGVDRSFVKTDEYPTSKCHISVTPEERILKTENSRPQYKLDDKDIEYMKNSSSVFLRAVPDILDKYVESEIKSNLFVTLQGFTHKKFSLSSLLQTNPRLIFCNEEEFSLIENSLENFLCSECKVIQTQGRLGCKVYSDKGVNSFDSYDVESIDPTGAGDAFGAGYIYGTIKEWAPHFMAYFANALGALTTTTYGARSKPIMLEDIKRFMQVQKG